MIILIWNALLFLRTSTETELTKRAATTAILLATITQDAVIAKDLSGLESFLINAINAPELVYIRIRNNKHVLAEAGQNSLLKKPFHPDKLFKDVSDGVYDTFAEIEVAGSKLGRIEIGISTEQQGLYISKARQKISTIALVEMALCALFSFLLGSLLVRRLQELQKATERIAGGDLEFRIKVTAKDEIGKVAESFNLMAKSLKKDNIKRLRAEKTLATEKERLAVTLRSVGDGVIATDKSGNVVLLNKVAEKLTGWKTEEATGLPLEEVFHIINEQTRKKCENPVNKVLANGQIVGLANHTALITKDGRELSIADSAAPILDIKSEVIGVVLVFRDITDQVMTEKELFNLFTSISPKVHEAVTSGQYSKALTLMLEMKEPVDAFFDQVMVMAEDPLVKQNRLNMLTGLGELILQVGDISKFQE